MAAAPVGYHTVTPYLIVHGVPALIEFLKQVFSADEFRRATEPEGRVYHTRVRIGDSVVMVGEAGENQEPFPAVLYVFVDDVDGTYRLALEHGATSLREPADQYYGDRNAGVRDPFGNQWWVANHKEDIDAAELERRARELGR